MADLEWHSKHMKHPRQQKIYPTCFLNILYKFIQYTYEYLVCFDNMLKKL